MPQRELWAQAHATKVTWTYRFDPTDPQGPSQLHMFVTDQADKLMEHQAVTVPWDETFELVQTALVESWQG